MAYWTQADLEARLSVETVKQIFDDDNSGTADSNPISRLQADADSYVEGFLAGIYDLSAVRASPPNEVKRLSLDVAVAFASMRHAEYVRRDGKALLEVARAALTDLRGGVTRLDTAASPEPAGNSGGLVYDNAPRLLTDASDGTYRGGDF